MGETLTRVRLAQADDFSLSFTCKCKMIDYDSPIFSSTDCVIRCNDTIWIYLGYFDITGIDRYSMYSI